MALRQLPLRLQLRADEADGHDPVLLGRPQQPAARPIPRGFVLERHLAEPCEGIPDMRRVVDRETALAARIDVGEGAVGKLSSLLRAESRHPRHDRSTGWPRSASSRSPVSITSVRSRWEHVFPIDSDGYGFRARPRAMWAASGRSEGGRWRSSGRERDDAFGVVVGSLFGGMAVGEVGALA